MRHGLYLRHTLVLISLTLTTLLVACSGTSGSVVPSAPAGSGAPAASGSRDAEIAAAKTYCTDKGGMLVDRTATWNTNADPAQFKH